VTDFAKFLGWSTSVKAFAQSAEGKGFLLASSTPLTRSSYHADADFAALRNAREAKLAARK